MKRKIKIIVTDDHQLFRDGLTALLNKYEFIEVLYSVENGVKLINLLKDGVAPDIVLLDLSMPEMNGFEVLKILQKEYKHLKSIAISMHDDGNYISKCAQFGAFGYLLKNSDEKEVILAIKQVFQGHKYYNQEVANKLIQTISEDDSSEKLTKKELEILELLSQGLTTKEIATQLYISPRTVETHRSNMLKKLKVKNTAELITKIKSEKNI